MHVRNAVDDTLVRTVHMHMLCTAKPPAAFHGRARASPVKNGCIFRLMTRNRVWSVDSGWTFKTQSL